MPTLSHRLIQGRNGLLAALLASRPGRSARAKSRSPRTCVRIGKVGPTVTRFTDTGLKPRTTYSYLVRAWHPDRGVSGRSNEASVTTPLAQ